MYETEQHLAREREFVDFICNCWNCRLGKLGIKYGFDYSIVLNNSLEVKGWLEIKCRNNRSDSFDTYMVGLDKWMAGVQLVRSHPSQKFVLAVEFTDKRMYFLYDDLKFKDYKIYYQGRTVQTRDDQDIEPCVFIPMKYFREFVL